MKKQKISVAILFCLVFILGFNYAHATSREDAEARRKDLLSKPLSSDRGPLSADAYSASDVLGQTDGGGAPVFNTNDSNNGGAIGPRGFGGSEMSTAIDTVNHRLFEADNGNCHVMVFNLDSNNNLIDHTADYVIGQANFSTGDCYDTGQNNVGGDIDQIALDEQSSLLYVADESNDRVLVFDVRDPNSSNRTLCGYTSTGLADNMNASCVLGQSDFSGFDSGIGQTQMDTPEGIALDPDHHRLYVLTWGDGHLLVYDVRDSGSSDLNLCGTITNGLANGAPAACLLGKANFADTDRTASQNQLRGGSGLAYDPISQSLFVFDDGDRVLDFDVRDPSSSDLTRCGTTTTGLANHMNASCVLGQTGFSISDSPSSVDSKTFSGEGLGIDPVNEMLFVNDYSASARVLVFNVGNISNNMDASAVLGQGDFSTSDTGISQTQLSGVYGGMAFDTSNNRIYVTDDHRTMIYNFIKFTTDSLADGKTKTAYSANLATTNSQGDVTYSVSEGSLPPGLTITGSTITGTPTTAGTFNFTLKATDTFGVSTFDDTLPTSITVKKGAVFIASGSSGGASTGGKVDNPVVPPTVPSTPTTPSSDCLSSYAFNPITGKPCTTTTTTPTNSKPSACTVTTDLKFGSRGDEVKCLQTKLGAIVIDGIFGIETKTAVMLFQKNHSPLEVDGVVGPKTRAVL